MREELKLESIRSNLIRQEETIIFALIERAQFGKNLIIYKPNGIAIPDYNGSFMEHLLYETEKIHSKVRRYTAPDEHSFSKDLPQPYINNNNYQWPIKKTDININNKILEIYINKIIPLVCNKEDDGNYGSSAVCDINSLQAISKRIHYGKYVAESKYLQDEAGYNKLIVAKDKQGIMDKLTDISVENKLLNRVALKAGTYGQDPDNPNPDYKIKPEVIRELYFEYIIPLTKEVEYLYLLERFE